MYELTDAVPYNSNGEIDNMPFNEMEVGQSFLIPVEADDKGELNYASKMNLVAKARKVFPDMHFASKKVEEDGVTGVRVWKLDPATKPAPRKKPAAKKAAAKAA